MKKPLVILRFLFLTILIFVSNFNVRAQSQDKNYIHSISPKIALTPSEIESTSPENLLEKISYFDGLGRTTQVISIRQSSENTDIVKHIDYDEYGRTRKIFLPYASRQSSAEFIPNVSSEIIDYYSSNYNDTRPYTEAVYDGTPLNRVTEQSGPGEDWAISSNSDTNHTLRYNYQTNKTTEVPKYTIEDDGSIAQEVYPANELLKKIVKNENWTTGDGVLNTMTTFTDKNGKKVAQIIYEEGSGNSEPVELCTHFVYDNKDLLRYVLTPKLIQGSNIGNFQNYNVNWPIQDFLAAGKMKGRILFSITDNILNVKVLQEIGPYPATLGRLTMKPLATTPQLPDMYLGKVYGIPLLLGTPEFEVGEARIVDGNFVIIGSSSTPFRGLNIDITVNLGAPVLSQENLDHLAFQFKYDAYNRKVEQKTPGKGWEYMIYDNLDRPILTQDANMRERGQWIYTKYDAFDRSVYSGRYYNIATRQELQASVENIISSSTNKSNYESRLNSGSVTTINTTYDGDISISYSNSAFPKDNILTVHAVNYYDNYNFVDSDKPATPISIEGQTITDKTRGLLTGKWVKVLGQPVFSKAYSYYDSKGRSISTIERNYLGGTTKIDSKLDFIGKTLATTTSHRRTASDPDISIVDSYTYDRVNRPLLHTQKINSQPEERITLIDYDLLGFIKRKDVGGRYSTFANFPPLQRLDYSFDVRGRIVSLNNVNSLGNDLFAYKLNFNNTIEGNSAVNRQYNGNLAQNIWRSAVDNVKKSYSYSYDKLNRFETAHYRTGDNLTSQSGQFETRNVTYDYNGNIKSLRRNSNTGQQIDKLSYTYDAGNRLLSISDLSSNSDGFVDGYTSGSNPDYDYDSNGNIILDRNRDISFVDYNFLDQLDFVQFNSEGSTVSYTYDILGNKLSQTYTAEGQQPITTDYLGGFQYNNEELQHFPTSEGYVYNLGGVFKYVYVYSDHLGNNRLSYSDTDNNGYITSSEVLSASNYYAMGMIHTGQYVSGFGSSYNYKYQGKEQQYGSSFYDFGSRMYDSSVGRWFNTDPQNQFYSPYTAMGNNWTIGVDPDGEIWHIVGGAFAGGLINVVTNWSTITSGDGSFWEKVGKGAAFFGTGAAAGAYVAATGDPTGAGVILGAGNSALTQAFTTGSVDVDQVIEDGIIGGITSRIGFGIGAKFTPAVNRLSTQLFGSSSSLASQYFSDLLGNVATDLTMGTLQGVVLEGQSPAEAFENSTKNIITTVGTSLIGTTGRVLHDGYQTKQIEKREKIQRAQAEEEARPLGKETGQNEGFEIPAVDQVTETGLLDLSESIFRESVMLEGMGLRPESINGIDIYGDKGLVGDSFNRNIYGVYTPDKNKSLKNFREFVKTLEAEAINSGANQFSVFGTQVHNDGFLNPTVARRFGYDVKIYVNGVSISKKL